MIVSVTIVIMMCLLGSENDGGYIIYVIIFGSIVGACVLGLFIIMTMCVIIGRRQVRKKRVVLNAGR